MFYATANPVANIGPLPKVLGEFMMVEWLDADSFADQDSCYAADRLIRVCTASSRVSKS